MAEELYLSFERDYYSENKCLIKRKVADLPSFVCAVSSEEHWLKDPQSQSPWKFDLRVFFEESRMLVEVSCFTDAFNRDFRGLLSDLSSSCAVRLVDSDHEPYDW